jgi:hypothetical protein
MSHLTEEDLVRHFYGDGRGDAEPAVDEHLRACPECQAAWQEIAGALKLVDASTVPEPDAAFEQRMWARVQPALDARTATAFPFPGRRRSWPGLVAAAGLAAAVTAAVFVARAWEPSPGTAAPAMAAAADPNGRERVLLAALDDHFQRSEMLLVELLNAADTDELGFERETADDLVDWSRLYRATAVDNGKFRLAEMLEDLESVLVEIARSPDQMDPSDLRWLRAGIEDDNLLFKVRAVSQQIQDRRIDLLTE